MNKNWHFAEASTTGRLHTLSGAPCQDKTAVLSDKGIHAMALADGAGSARLSDIGAERVTSAVCRYLCDHFDALFAAPPEDAKAQLISHAMNVLRETAEEQDCHLRDLSSTLLAAAFDRNRYLCFHLGDGIIGMSVGEEPLRAVTHSQNGRYANETFFVNHPSAAEIMQLVRGEGENIRGFALMSDGLALLHNKETGGFAALDDLLHRLSITSGDFLRPILQEEMGGIKHAFDDCSLLLAARHQGAYNTLSPQEQQDFFQLSDGQGAVARYRYCSILDCLDEARSLKELAVMTRLKRSCFLEKWLRPLLEMGYVLEENGLCTRTVHPDRCSLT